MTWQISERAEGLLKWAFGMVVVALAAFFAVSGTVKTLTVQIIRQELAIEKLESTKESKEAAEAMRREILQAIDGQRQVIIEVKQSISDLRTDLRAHREEHGKQK